MKHIVCFSGGHSSGLVAIEVVRRFGKESVVLMNHNISKKREGADIKRFKIEVAAYLGIPITYENYKGLPEDKIPDQFDICTEHGIIVNPKGHNAICTFYLKTEPFMAALQRNFSDKKCVVYYGFDKKEIDRISRRKQILGAQGYAADFPLAFWDRSIKSTLEVGIEPPNTYSVWKHANCTGCLKGGYLHWYVTYVHDKDAFRKAMAMEESTGYSVLVSRVGGERRPLPLEELAGVFCEMQSQGIPATEHQNEGVFIATMKRFGVDGSNTLFKKPCECLI